MPPSRPAPRLALALIPLLAAAVPAPDPCAKAVLDELGLPRDAASAVLRLRYLPPGPGREEAQDDALRALGLGDAGVGRLRASGVLDPDPLEQRALWTLPPAVLANARPGAWVSRPGSRGFLENVLVQRRRGEVLVVSRPGDGVEEIVPRRRASQPVAPGRRVVVKGIDGLPVLALARDVQGGRVVLDGDVYVPVADLRLTPRAALATAGMRAPESKDEATADELEVLDMLLGQIEAMHRAGLSRPSWRRSFVRANNRFMEKVRGTLASQGVSSSLEPSKGMKDAWNIRIHGVSPDGNRAAGLYARLAERLNTSALTASVVDSLDNGSVGFFEEPSGRVDVGPDSLLSMMLGRWDHTALHGFTHQMFDSRRRSGEESVFDVGFWGLPFGSVRKDAAEGERIFEQAYAYVAGSARLARRLRHGPTDLESEIILKRVRHHVQYAFLLMADAVAFLDEVVRHFRLLETTAAEWDGVQEWGDALVFRGCPGSGCEVRVPKRLLARRGEVWLEGVVDLWNFASGLLLQAEKVLKVIDAPAAAEEKARDVVWEVGRLRLMTRKHPLLFRRDGGEGPGRRPGNQPA